MKEIVKRSLCALAGATVGLCAGIGIMTPRIKELEKRLIYRPVALDYNGDLIYSDDPLAEIPPATEPERKELWYDDNDIKIYYVGDTQIGCKLYVYNNSEYYANLNIVNVCINGQSFETTTIAAYEPNTEGFLNLSVKVPDLQEKGITRVNDISFNVQIRTFTVPMTDFIDTYETETFTVTR